MVKKWLLVVAGFSLRYVVVIVSVIFCIGITNVEAVPRTWDGGGATTSWSEAVNWSGDTVPGSADDVTFDATSVKNCTVDVVVTVTSITVTTGYTGLITQNQNVIVSGVFSVNGTANRWSVSANITLSVGGSFTTLGTSSTVLNASGVTLILTGTGTFDLTGTLGQQVSILTCAQNGNITTQNTTTNVLSALNIGTGTFSIAAGVNFYGTTFTMGSGSVISGTGGLGLYSSITIPGGTYSAQYPLNISATCTLGGNIIENSAFPNGVTVTTSGVLNTNNYNITANSITVTGTLNCGSSNIIVDNFLRINSTGTLNAESSYLRFIGTDTTFSDWRRDAGGVFNPGTSTVEFATNTSEPNTTDNSSETFYNLIKSGTGKTTTLIGNFNVTNNLTIQSGATLNTGINTVTVNGSLIVSSNSDISLSGSNVIVNGTLVNNGTFNNAGLNLTLNNITNNGSLTLTNIAPTGNLTNSGTLNTSSLTISVNKQALLNAGSIWNVASGNTLTIKGTLKSSGTSTSMATIQSSSTSGYFGLLTSGGSVDLSYCKLYYLNKDGLKIDSTPSAITKMDNVELKYGETGGTHLQVLNGQSITITNMVFDDIRSGTNITVKNKSKIKVNKYKRGKNPDSIESGSSVLWGAEQSINYKEGGKIYAGDDLLTYIEIPADTLKRDLTFTLAQLLESELSEPSQPTKVIRAYTLDAVDTSGKEVKILDGPITLVIHTTTDGTNVLDSSGLSTGIKVSEASNKLSMGYWNERYWVKLGGRVELLNIDQDVTVSTRVSHLSRYAIVTKEATQAIATNVSPNPFTPASSDSRFNKVTFSFNNENQEEVELKIWDITGVLVRTITSSGTSSISWDGRNEYGEIVEGGVYIWQLKVGNSVAGKGTVVVAK